jgi:tryptophan 7-halogenase
VSFTDAVCVQGRLCDLGLAPKQISTPEYGVIANYGYHLDAGKFAPMLQKHCVEKLGVKHVLDNVLSIESSENGDIKALITASNGRIEGDLFVDCSGLSSLLLGEHYKIPFVDKKDILFNDTALAIQVPYTHQDDPIASHTLSTAQTAGWIWDIGLFSRRGVGHVFSSSHISDEQAEEQLRHYLEASIGRSQAQSVSARKIKIRPGHRQLFWHRNCVAIGMSSGFIEPLEASALVMVELSAKMVAEQLPANRAQMDIIASRFNELFTQRWQRIIEFLKMHYVLTKRTDSEYWLDNINPKTIPQRLQDLLTLWTNQSPWGYDELSNEEMFPSASYQYVYYGMGGETLTSFKRRSEERLTRRADELFGENYKQTQLLLAALSSNRELIEKIKKYGLQKI